VEYLDVRKDKGVAAWHGCIESKYPLLSFPAREDDFVLWAHNKEVNKLVTSGRLADKVCTSNVH
jgi:hypothetical protein